MKADPFMTLRVCSRKDALRGRHQARLVAQLLHFEAHEQACVAAGTFLVACQALERLGQAQLCFLIEQRQLHVFAEAVGPPGEAASASVAEPSVSLRLTKPVPPGQPLATADLGWLVGRIEQTGRNGLFAEIVKQNQEILSLLHELRDLRARLEQKGADADKSQAA